MDRLLPRSGSQRLCGRHRHVAVLIDGDDVACGCLAEAVEERPAPAGRHDDCVRIRPSLDAKAFIDPRVEKRRERILPELCLRVARPRHLSAQLELCPEAGPSELT
jgi:hypothetical protein